MTGTHPNATGTLGEDAARWIEYKMDVTLHWWQRLTLARMLEVDAAGRLVWRFVILSTPRQVGKSALLRWVALWRIHKREYFGEEQTVLHTSRDLNSSREVQRDARRWAREHSEAGYGAREQNGAQEVSAPDGSRWIIRDQRGVYSYSVSMAVVDEAWGVEAQNVNEGLVPTMAARKQPQLLLTSTAHRLSTDLMLRRRAAAIEQLEHPKNALILEWSADPGAELDIRTAASIAPVWTPMQAELAEDELSQAEGPSIDGLLDPASAFRGQWLNIWPNTAGSHSRSSPLLGEGGWAGLTDINAAPPKDVVAAIEDRTGLGCAVAVAGVLPDSRVLVWGRTFTSRREAIGWLSLLAPKRILAGASIAADIKAASRVGGAELSIALPKFRELCNEGRLLHDGGRELSRQIASLWVAERIGGLAITSSAPADLARCAVWAVGSVATQPAPRAKWAMI